MFGQGTLTAPSANGALAEVAILGQRRRQSVTRNPCEWLRGVAVKLSRSGRIIVASILAISAGFIIGARFGVFHFIAATAVICIVAFCIGLGSGLELAGIRAAQMWFCITSGFILALVASWLVARAAPKRHFPISERSRRF